MYVSSKNLVVSDSGLPGFSTCSLLLIWSKKTEVGTVCLHFSHTLGHAVDFVGFNPFACDVHV